MDFKKIVIILNIFIAALLLVLEIKLQAIIIIMIIVNISYTTLFYFLHKKQNDELTRLSNAIEKITNGTLLDSDVFYDEYLINKVVYNVQQLNKIFINKNIELKNSQNEVQDTISNLAHQLRNSLHSIMLHTDHLKNDNESKVFLNEIYKLNHFVDELVKVSNIDIINNTLETDKCSINDIVLEAIKFNYVLAKQNNISIEYESKKEIEVVANYRWSLEAVINVINNAIKYGASNSIVKVKIEENYIYSKIIIEDNNEIIQNKNLNQIFEKFWRGNNATNIDGMGIGLYLTKSILVKQNGFIKYSNENSTNKFELYFIKA